MAGPQVYGFVLATISAGAFTVSIFLGKLGLKQHFGAVVFGGIFGIGLTMAALGVLNTGTAVIILGFVLGGIGAMINVPLQALIQAISPKELLGRVVTAMGSLVSVAQPARTIVTGAIADRVLIPTEFQVYGLLIMFIAIFLFLPFKKLRKAELP